MVNSQGRQAESHPSLDRLFAALGNRHRREIVHQLGLQPFPISRLAATRGLSLPAMTKHVHVLEAAGLVTRRKVGRTTFLALERHAILDLQAWLAQFHAYWGTSDETLENYARQASGDSIATEEEP